MKRDTFKSFQWSFLTALLRKVFLFGIFLLIAKEITKEELGLFREFSLVIGILTGISFLGYKDLFIIKRDSFTRYYKNLWAVTWITSLVFMAILIGIAPFIGGYYKSEIITKLLIYLSPLLPLEIIRNTTRSFYQKRLKFKLLSIVETINVISYCLLIVLYLFIGLTVTRLIIIFYIGNVIELFLLLLLERKELLPLIWSALKPAVFQDLILTIKENFRFLGVTSLNNLIALSSADLPVLIIGYLYNPAYVGIYYLAYQLIGQPVVLACNSLSQILFPTFALLKLPEIEVRLNKFFKIVTLGVFPLLFLLVVAILNLTPLFLGDKWAEALPIVLILSFSLASNMLINPISSLPYVLELPQYEMIYFILNIILKSSALLLGYRYGFETSLKFYATTTVFLHFIFLFMIFKITKMAVVKSFSKVLISITPTLLIIGIYNLLNPATLLLKIVYSLSLVTIYYIIIYRSPISLKLK